MIWQAWTQEPHTAEDLSVDAKLVLGIITTCNETSLKEISDISFIKKSKVREIRWAIKNSEHPTIKEILRNGLPLSCVVSIPHRSPPLRCKVCSQGLASFPCAYCAIHNEHMEFEDDEYIADPIISPAKTTHCIPGSSRKIEVMRERLESGNSLFSPSDCKLE